MAANWKRHIRQSETAEILRSQINMNPFNPKRHSEEKVLEQKRNFMRVGFMGGVTWNRTTGNLVDGHRRIKAMDLLYGYDGTPGTDYRVKVEAVELDAKSEKEQMTFMALGNTRADYSMIAEYLPDIDCAAAGIDGYDLEQIRSFIPSADDLPRVETWGGMLAGEDSADHATAEEETGKEFSEEERKSRVKEAKRRQIELAADRYGNLTAYITLSFGSAEEKRLFCELAGIREDETFVPGRRIMELFD